MVTTIPPITHLAMGLARGQSSLKPLKMLGAGALLAGSVCLANVPVALADPLTPLPPNEIDYLAHLHQLLPGTGDSAAFHSDGWLLDQGRHACEWRDIGEVGYGHTYVSPIVTQVAFADLCPQKSHHPGLLPGY
jgi:23S rRNA A1618 N6-methylase RlmF